jgi:hypothetical protein
MNTETGRQLGWFAAISAIAFAVPYLGTSVLDLNHDVYLIFYVAAILGALAAYARSTQLDVKSHFTRHLGLTALLTVLISAFLIANVLSEDSTPRPDGLFFVFELVWRGAIYGSVDALLLSALPCLVAYRLFREDLAGATRKAGFTLTSLLLIVTITAVYHLGYEQYRDDGVKAPEIGNVIMSVPMLATLNPLGSMVAHSCMHVAAVAHEYETEIRLPPAASAD